MQREGEREQKVKKGRQFIRTLVAFSSFVRRSSRRDTYSLRGSKSSRLEQELINSDETADVSVDRRAERSGKRTEVSARDVSKSGREEEGNDDSPSRAVLDGLDVPSHHENGPLDRLDEEIRLSSRDVVGSVKIGSRRSALSSSFCFLSFLRLTLGS